MKLQPIAFLVAILLASPIVVAGQKLIEKELVPLGTRLGKDKVDALTLQVFNDFAQTLKHKARIADDFWPFINQRVAETDGPDNTEEAQEFLRVGFNGFLRSYTLFQLDQDSTKAEIVFSKTAVIGFFGSARWSCDRACDVPPCCGRPSRCRRCK